MVEVVLENLSKYFGEVKAVDNISLKVNSNEFLTFLGPSGCGKTTTLRLIAGLEDIMSGNIYIDDQLANDLSPMDRNVAMVFQSYALYPHMTVFDNIAFPLKLTKVPKNEIKSRTKQVARMLGIEELLDRKPKELSGGQRQRTALGRAIVREPNVFLMDEPLSNLDAKLRVQMRAELKRLQKELKTTTIYVTHDQIEAMTMSDRIALMNKGKIMQTGKPRELYDIPNNVWVAGFIGTLPMNFIPCSLEEKNGETYLVEPNFSLRLPSNIAELVKKQATSSELILGIRPEDLSASRKQKPDSMETEVYLLELLGESVVIDLKIGDNIIRVKTSVGFEAEIGSRLYLTLDKNKMRVFDKKTQNLIV